MRVPVDDRGAAGKARRQPLLPPGAWAGIVCHPDHAVPGDLDDVRLRQAFGQCRVVHVPVHRMHRRAESAQLVEDLLGDDVTGVENQVGRAEPLDARIREAPARRAACACRR